MDIDKKLLKNIKDEFENELPTYAKMYEYYKGNSDAMHNYKFVTERSNNKTPINFIKKFIKEEVSYSVGNDVTYVSKAGNEELTSDIDYYLDHWNEGHDADLAKNMLIYSKCYELYYLDNLGQFSCKIVNPQNGYAYTDDFGNILLFMHVFRKKFDKNEYIDVYTDSKIIHCDKNFKEIGRDIHIFNRVPIAICELSEEGKDDTLFKDIKGLQDAYETNLSDISNEISDFRNAYMFLTGMQIAEEDISKMKSLGVMQSKDGKAEWLIKNINDTFIQNTLNTLEDKMYQMSSHINHNDKMTSNTSSLALKARLIALEQKCKLNQKSLADCIKTRLQFLFIYLKIVKNVEYDYRDIKPKFVANLPQDDMLVAQMISQLGEGNLSLETGLSLLSFVENPKNEMAKIAKENEEFDAGNNLLEEVDTDE